MGDGIRFVFDEEKAAQAAAWLIRRNGGSADCTTLLTLLYLADRRTLAETGYPITGDRMASTAHGPSLERIPVLADAGGQPDGDGPWRRWIDHSAGREATVRGKPPAGRLSRYDARTLRAVHAEFGGMDRQALRGYMRALPEWEDPHGSSRPIPPERILEAEGKTPAEIERCRREAASVLFLHRVLSSDPVPA